VLAEQSLAAGRYDEASAMGRRALVLFRTVRDRSGEAGMLHVLGRIDAAAQRPADARRAFEQAIGLYRALRDAPHEADVQKDLAALPQGAPPASDFILP
jgi:hypothetical protein